MKKHNSEAADRLDVVIWDGTAKPPVTTSMKKSHTNIWAARKGKRIISNHHVFAVNQPVFIKHSFYHLLALFLPSWQIWQMFSYHTAWVGLLLLLYVLTLKPSFHGEPVPLLSWCCFNISLPIKLVLHQVTVASSFCTHPPNSGWKINFFCRSSELLITVSQCIQTSPLFT